MARSTPDIQARAARQQALADERVAKVRARAAAMALARLRQATKGGARSARVGGDITASSGGALGTSYANAGRTHLRPGPRARGGSAQSHLTATVHDALRRDAQDLERNNPWARALLRALQDMIVADGPVLVCTTDDADFNARCEELSDRFDAGEDEAIGLPDVTGQRTLSQCCREAVRAAGTDGDIAVLRTTARGGSLQWIESERVGMRAPMAHEGRRVVSGVEIGDEGAPVAYWIGRWREEVGRSGIADPRSQNRTGAERRLAEDCTLLCNPLALRTGQYRGEPALQVCADKLERIDHVCDRVAIAVEIATLFGVVIKTEHPQQTREGLEAAADLVLSPQTGPRPDFRDVALGSGLAAYLRPGESIDQVKPEFPQQNLRDFLKLEMAVCAASLGMPIHVAGLDFGDTVYASAKAAVAVAQRGWLAWHEWLTTRLLRPLYRWKVAQWMDQGLLPAPRSQGGRESAWESHRWVLPQAPALNLKDEVQAAGAAVGQLFMTHEDACWMLGTGRSRDVLRRAAREREDMRRLGLSITQLPGSGGSLEARPSGRAEGAGAVSGGEAEES